MGDTIIKVEGLSKKYILHHQQERYTALRDVLSNKVKGLGRRALGLVGGEKRQPLPSREEFYALKDVSFEVKQGDRVGIIGRNGAGKSTLLKILSRITEPSSGRIEIEGRVASLLEVGTGFHPELTGRENIYLNGAILGMTRYEIKRKFDEIVNFAEVERFLDTPVKRYSSGMYVRLAFAVAAHLEPEILVVDEVLAVGDAQFQKKCLGKMEEVGKEGRTVLFVSHNMAAIKKLCNRSLLLKGGAHVFDGEVSESIARYMELGHRNADIFSWELGKEPTLLSAKLSQVTLFNGGMRTGAEISTEKSVQIVVEFEVLKPAKLGTTVMLANSEGVLMFSSISNHEANWHGKVRPVGHYKSVCEVPPNFLAAGNYSISLGFWEGSYEQGLVEKDILSFTAYDHGFVRGDLPYEIKNVLVMPLLNWTSEKVDAYCD